MIMLSVVFFSVFAALALWQVNRVFEKEHIQQEISRANQEQPLDLQARLDEQKLLEHLHYKARATGKFLSEQCFYVENVIFKGSPGLYVYCPFRMEKDTRVLLVNMGWMKKPQYRLQLPAYEVAKAERQIDGVISKPRSKPVVTSGVDKPNLELPNLWAYFDMESLRRQTGYDFYPVEFQLTSSLDEVLQRDWPEFEAKIGMHIGYAIHWAAFALVTLGLFLKFNVEKVKQA